MNFLRISEIKSIPEKEEGGHGFYWATTGLLPGLAYVKRKAGRPVCRTNCKEEREGQHRVTGPMLQLLQLAQERREGAGAGHWANWPWCFPASRSAR